jgi:hypothetical protein
MQDQGGRGETSRLEAFSDGVFAMSSWTETGKR